jgi:hypothetical protein
MFFQLWGFSTLSGPSLAISERDTDFSGVFPYPDPVVSGHNQGFFSSVSVPDPNPNLFLNVIQICSGVFPILIQYTAICLGVFLIMNSLFRNMIRIRAGIVP